MKSKIENIPHLKKKTYFSSTKIRFLSVYFLPPKMLLSKFCHLTRLVLDQSSLASPPPFQTGGLNVMDG